MSSILNELCSIGAVKFGQFLLKSGIVSPIYVDLRLIISYPELLGSISEALLEKMHPLNYDLLCGVPYTALPIATALSLKTNTPMILKRKEAKNHGLKKMVEGVVKPGQRCLIIEDIVTSGTSVLETAEVLRQEGLIVEEALVVLDREQGGKESLKQQGITLHSLYSLKELLACSH